MGIIFEIHSPIMLVQGARLKLCRLQPRRPGRRCRPGDLPWSAGGWRRAQFTNESRSNECLHHKNLTINRASNMVARDKGKFIMRGWGVVQKCPTSLEFLSNIYTVFFNEF